MNRNILRTVGLVIFAVIVLFGLTGYFAGEPALATAVVLLGAVGFFCIKNKPSISKTTEINKNADAKGAVKNRAPDDDDTKSNCKSHIGDEEHAKGRSSNLKGLAVYAFVLFLGVILYSEDLPILATVLCVLGAFGVVGMLYAFFNPNWKSGTKRSANKETMRNIQDKEMIQIKPNAAKRSRAQTIARVGYRPAPDIVKCKAPKYIVIDVETTGLSPDDDRIIEVAAVKCENDRIVDRFHSLVNPGRPIPSRVTQITGINNSDVKNAPDMNTIAPKLSEFIEDMPLVAHNANFDIKFIANSFKRAGVSKGMLYIDTLYLARIAFPDMQNHKLSTLIDEFGLLDHAQEHRAMSDVEATQRLYMICKSQLGK